MNNWKTTLGGILLAAGGALQAVGEEWSDITGSLFIAVGGFLAGFSAKDAKE